MEASGEGDQDWRLEAELEGAEARGGLHGLVGRLRDPEFVKEIEATVPHDVVVTHDGKLLFAYAADPATLASARAAIETVLAKDGIGASVRVSRWDEDFERWRQTDPPPSEQERAAEEAAERDEQAIVRRTMVISSGKMIRPQVEQTMSDWAAELGLQCEIIEHPHLLTTQVGFTVTGPHYKVVEFAKGLAAEDRSTIRTDTAVMLSPL